MNTQLTEPVYVELPKALIRDIHSKGDVFYYNRIRLELQGTTLFMRIQTWNGLEIAHKAGVNFKSHLPTLEKMARGDNHRILLMMLRA